MTNDEVLQGNKLIANFIQYDDVDCHNCKYTRDCNWQQCGLTNEEKVEQLAYHSSWDWLMPVVENIENLGYWTEICHSVIGTKVRTGVLTWCEVVKENHTNLLLDDCYTKIVRGEGVTKIEAVYKTVVEFIKWYNQQNK